MKNKRLLLLIILIVLILGYLILRHFRNEEKLEPIFPLNTDQIGTIEIWNHEHSIALAKLEDHWKIVRPVDWDADTLRVNNLFRQVLSAKYATTPMSVGEDAVSRYKLGEDEALHIRVSAGARVTHVLFSNIGNPWDYFRFEGKTDVYQIKSKVYFDYTPELYNWRSPIIVQYEEHELQSIRTKYAQNEYTLTRNEAIWTYQDSRERFDITYSNIAMMKIVSILQNFNTYVFFDNQEEAYRELFNNPECTVWLTLTNGKQQELSFAKLDDQRYLMMVDGDKRVFFAVSFDAVFRFMRHAEVFRRIQA